MTQLQTYTKFSLAQLFWSADNFRRNCLNTTFTAEHGLCHMEQGIGQEWLVSNGQAAKTH